MPDRPTKANYLPQDRFPEKYGSWALVAGASEGLGAAFAVSLARRGMNLLLVARRRDLLEALAEDCRRRFGVEARPIVGDLGSPNFAETLQADISALELGLVVYNAAFVPVGEFALAEMADLMRVVDVNVRAPVMLLRSLLPAMIERKRGAVVLMSSLAGDQGSPRIAAYAASKAFNRVLAEGLWHELKAFGIDVIACRAGAIRTPGFASASQKGAPGTMDPEMVAERTLRALGRGPFVVPGFLNSLAAWFMGRLLPRRAAIGIMALSAKSLTQATKTQAQ